MKILVNGNTISEQLEIIKLDKIIGHIKRNKKRYLALVVAIAFTIDLSGITLVNTTVATVGLETITGSITPKLELIIDALKFLIKYSCLGMGLKTMIICILNGGNLKQAMTEGTQYWLAYLFIEFYPTLFDL